MPWFEFALFAILGWCVFSNPQGNARTVWLVLFAVLMVVWLALGLSGYRIPFPQR